MIARALTGLTAICALVGVPLLLLAQSPPPVAIPIRPQPGAPVRVQPAPVPAPAPVKTQPAVTPAASTPAASTPAERPVSVPAGLNLTNASLTEVIDILARDLKINYILDPKVQGKVTINTYGELRAVDVRNLLETILRMNGFMMVQVGNVYRIVPSDAAARLPISPEMNAKEFNDSEQPVLNLIFLKYVTSAEIAKLLEPFLGEGYKMISYDPANLLIIQDNSRSMKRTVELISMFDSETLAGQRVKSFILTNARPSDVSKELDTIFKAYSLSDKGSALKFIPIDRISTLIAVAANPAAFKDVGTWLEKLDVPVKLTAGATDNHVYKLKYGRAEIIGGVIAQLYGSSVPQTSGYGLTGYGGYRGGISGAGGGLGLNGGANRYGGGGGSAFGSGGAGGTYGSGNGNGAFPDTAGTTGLSGNLAAATAANQTPPAASGATPFGPSIAPDQTGQYLTPGSGSRYTGPRIIPNPYDNTLLVQGTPQQWESILNLLEQLDIPPRQVLIDAKIYEVDLTGNLQFGVEATLEAATATGKLLTGALNPTAAFPVTLTAGMLVGKSRQLLGVVNALDNKSLARSISAPQLIATDSIPASITVGQEVPTLAATSVSTGLGGSTTSAVQNVGTGVSLNIIARVNASGVVTLVIDQDVSAPEASTFGNIDSPSFTRRNVSTQVTVEDGDTIAIGGIILETNSVASSGIPGLSRLPYVGALFGSKTYAKQRTELIIFLTPHVIYDTNGVAEATEELKSRMQSLKKDIRNQ